MAMWNYIADAGTWTQRGAPNLLMSKNVDRSPPAPPSLMAAAASTPRPDSSCAPFVTRAPLSATECTSHMSDHNAYLTCHVAGPLHDDHNPNMAHTYLNGTDLPGRNLGLLIDCGSVTNLSSVHFMKRHVDDEHVVTAINQFLLDPLAVTVE